MTLHHIIFDRASLTQVFLPELWELYEARVQGRADELDEVKLQYADYAMDQREKWQEGRSRGAPEVLEGIPGGRADGAGAARGPPAVGAAELPGRNAGVCAQ